MTQQHGLAWGVLDFVNETPTEDGWLASALADNTSLGNPEPVVEIVQSLLTDGALAVTQRWDNRQVAIRVRLSAPTAAAGPALAAAEAALMGEVLADRKSPLVYTPPADLGAVCVFDVVNARLDRDDAEGWDFDEVAQECRYYLLTLTCLPFARAEETSVASAIPLPPGDPGDPPTVVSIDTCGSTTDWAVDTTGTFPTGPTATTFNGESAIRATAFINSASDRLRLVRTGSISVPAGEYLQVDVRLEASGNALIGNWHLHALVGATLHVRTPVSIASGGGEGGTTRLFFGDIPAGTTAIRVLYDWTGPASWSPTSAVGLSVLDVSRTNALSDAAASTPRQQSRIIPVSGSAPTTAALRVYDETPAALGTEILVHTSRNTNFQPPLRRWLASSASVTADTARISGGRHTLTTPTVFEIPADLFTEGTYALIALMDVTTGGDLTWSARMVDSTGATTVGSSVTQSDTVTLGTTSGYEVVRLGALSLPIVLVEGTQLVELTLTGTANMTLDEAWTFGLDDGALTWVRDDDDLTWVEIRSPELGAARPSVYGGLLADRSDGVCVDWKCESFGAHRFEPGQMQVFTVTTSTLSSQSEIEHYRRYHSHVIDED